ncbi:hypothetical protein C1H46_009708 [Malus baccata]|uniref:Uncharacterized protein n=1 Tax=Malus baccata TaxID=106549 RepID=A0A540N130_MALBA|nr:hypothetical protein C1H46_009708 [Malus baccata]
MKVSVVAERKIGMRRSRRSIGLVLGSISVVHQLHALVMNKCLRIDARLVRVEAEDSGEVRVVVLVDVYLLIAMLAGWQFPRSGSVAGALFRHLSSDWGERSAMLINGDYLESTLRANRNIWNLYDCHVFGCKLHHDFTDSSFSSRRPFPAQKLLVRVRNSYFPSKHSFFIREFREYSWMV